MHRNLEPAHGRHLAMNDMGTGTGTGRNAAAMPRGRAGGAGVVPETKRKPSLFIRTLGVIGELLITAGVLVLLYIVWSLWWTDVLANSDQGQQVEQAQGEWGQSQKIGTPRTDAPPAPDHVDSVGALEGLVYIPSFGRNAVHTIKYGTGLEEILDTGSFGHYEGTQFAGEVGNYAITAHRQTYGAALRDIDKMQSGDAIVVQTPKAFLVYHVVSHEIVEPTAVRVLDPNPLNPGATATDRMLTMTTCHPPFVSNLRWITYAKLDHWVDPATGIPEEIAGMSAN